MEPRVPYNFSSNLVFLLDFKKPILNKDIRLDNLDSDATKNSSHLVLQKIIDMCFCNSGSPLQIKRNKYGKPFLTNKENAWFNLSHSDSAVALVLSRIGDVGIDIERSTYEKNYLNIAKRFFHDEEKEALDQLDPHTAQRQSHMLWCLKEAYIKAIGKGLTQPLNSFKFELKHHHIHLYEPEEPNISERWTCHYHELEKNYGLSVCIPYDTPVEYFCLNSNKKIQPGAI